MKMNIPYTFKIAERFLIFITPASFFCCLLSILRDITGGYSRNIINYPNLFLALFYALAVFLVVTIFFNENSRTAKFIRLIVYFSIATGIITFLLRNFINSPILFIISPVMSVLYKKIYEPFFEHDGFERQCLEKNNSAQQKELYDYVYHLSEAAKGYRQNRFILFIMAVITAAFAGLAISSHINLSILSIITFIVYIVCFFTHLFIYSQYVREAVYATDGFVNVFDFRPIVVFTSIIIFAVTFIFALLVSSNHSPLKLSYLTVFLRLFKKPENLTAAPIEYQTNEMIIDQRIQQFQALGRQMTEEDNSSGYVFAIICGAFFGISILWFFISPFVKRAFSKALRNVDFKAMFKKFFTGLKEIFKNMFTKKFKYSVKQSENARRFGKEMEEYLKASKKSKEKKEELDRLTRKFMKIIDWGTAQGIEYTKNLAPQEYTEQLKKSSAIRAGFLFEKALYDKECLSKDEENEFSELVEKVIS